MLPTLCDAVGAERATNHMVRWFFLNSNNNIDVKIGFILRVTAIKYMRRAGMDWLSIAKVTGGKFSLYIKNITSAHVKAIKTWRT